MNNLEPIAKGRLAPKKRAGLSRLVTEFFAHDWSEFKEHLLWEIILPVMKSGTETALDKAVHYMFGNGPTYNNGTYRSPADQVSYVPYNGYSRQNTVQRNKYQVPQQYSRSDMIFREIIVEPIRNEAGIIMVDAETKALDVLHAAEEIIATCGNFVSVAKILQLLGINPNIDGWTLENIGYDANAIKKVAFKEADNDSILLIFPKPSSYR